MNRDQKSTFITGNGTSAEATQRIATTATSAVTIAGLAATCVSVPLPAGSPIYCVLENGLLARMDNGDVNIELTSFSDGVDELAFLAVSD